MKHNLKHLLAFSIFELVISVVVIGIISAAFTPVISKKLTTKNTLTGTYNLSTQCSQYNKLEDEDHNIRECCTLCNKFKCFTCSTECTKCEEGTNTYKTIAGLYEVFYGFTYGPTCSCLDSYNEYFSYNPNKISEPDFNKYKNDSKKYEQYRLKGTCTKAEYNVVQDKKICRQCIKGYYLDNNICKPCEAGYVCRDGKKKAKVYPGDDDTTPSGYDQGGKYYTPDDTNKTNKDNGSNPSKQSYTDGNSSHYVKYCTGEEANGLQNGNNCKTCRLDDNVSKTGCCATCPEGWAIQPEINNCKCLKCPAGTYEKNGVCVDVTDDTKCQPIEGKLETDVVTCASRKTGCIKCDAKYCCCSKCDTGYIVKKCGCCKKIPLCGTGDDATKYSDNCDCDGTPTANYCKEISGCKKYDLKTCKCIECTNGCHSPSSNGLSCGHDCSKCNDCDNCGNCPPPPPPPCSGTYTTYNYGRCKPYSAPYGIVCTENHPVTNECLSWECKPDYSKGVCNY